VRKDHPRPPASLRPPPTLSASSWSTPARRATPFDERIEVITLRHLSQGGRGLSAFW